MSIFLVSGNSHSCVTRPIIRPDIMAVRRSEAHTRAIGQPQSTPRRLVVRDFQPFAAPEPCHPPVVPSPSLPVVIPLRPSRSVRPVDLLRPSRVPDCSVIGYLRHVMAVVTTKPTREIAGVSMPTRTSIEKLGPSLACAT